MWVICYFSAVLLVLCLPLCSICLPVSTNIITFLKQTGVIVIENAHTDTYSCYRLGMTDQKLLF